MKRVAILLIASAALCTPALAEEVGVGVGPVGVTVGSGPDHDRVVHDRTIVREREPRNKVIIKKERRPDVVEKKTIIHHDD